MGSGRDIIVKDRLNSKYPLKWESVEGRNLLNMINAPLSTEHNLEII